VLPDLPLAVSRLLTRVSPQCHACFSAKGWVLRSQAASFPIGYALSLLQFPAARKASAQRADGLSVRHNVFLPLLILLFLIPGNAGESTLLLRKRVSEVRLTLVATDGENRPLPNLSPTDIAVLDNGQPVSNFELRSAADLPLRLAILIDLSDSTRSSWPTVRNALIESLQQVIRPGDEILILTFNNRIAMQRTLTDPSQLDLTLQSSSPGGLTALYDSLYMVCDHGLFNSGAEPHRSALILFSDGEDDLSRHSLNEAISRAQLAGVAVYSVTNHPPKQRRPGDFVLRDIARATGGRDFVVKDARQLQEALAAINQELRSSYLLYYRPPDESGARTFRRVFVVSTRGDSSHLRSRAGYFTGP
jgi:VWFA-related protein